MKKKKLIYVGFAFQQHLNTHAGYHQIQHYVKYDVKIDAQTDFNFVFNTVKKLPYPLLRRYRNYFGYRLWFTELRCILRAIFFRNQVFHIVYGENIYKNLGKYTGKTNKIVCTYHQPISVFKENTEWIEPIKLLDKIILMGADDHEYFKKLNANVVVKFIPHGINTNYYYPLEQKKKRSILMVGNWLRDFEFANKVFEQLFVNDKELKINVVTNKENFKHFSANSRLIHHNNITDSQLRDLYQVTKLVFLPLVEFTANNAILEAAACGAEILVATNKINTSYFDEKQISFVGLNQEEAIKQISIRLNEKFELKNARQFVVDNYSWDVIGQTTSDFLQE